MTVLRLTPLGGTRLGPALAAAGSVVLTRSSAGAFADVSATQVACFVRELAFAGVAAALSDVDLARPAGAIAARAFDLRPVPAGALDLDVVRIERVPLGRATREILRRRLWGALPATAAARERCRQHLRGADVLFGWSRRAWASPQALRARAVRIVLRPIVFGREAVERWEPTGRTTALDDTLSRWFFG